jgi:hypothetical protein
MCFGGSLHLQLEQHGDVSPRTVAALDDWGCKFHATPCGRLRWRACSSVHVRGITIEELYIYDYKFLQCDGTNYHGALCRAVRIDWAVHASALPLTRTLESIPDRQLTPLRVCVVCGHVAAMCFQTSGCVMWLQHRGSEGR